MRQVADTFEAEVKLRGKIKAAMTYPVVVFVMAILMCIGMLLFVVPIFEDMFADLGGKLPLPTRILVALSAGMKLDRTGARRADDRERAVGGASTPTTRRCATSSTRSSSSCRSSATCSTRSR